MQGKPRILGIVPARLGSKRLPDKNIQTIGGVSLVGWAILAAKAAKMIDHVVVTTDGKEIAQESLRWGADSVLHRPPDLAGDQIPMESVVEHALSIYNCNAFALFQPTNPIRPPDFIDYCLKAWYSWAAPCELFNTKNPRNRTQDGLLYAAWNDYIWHGEPNDFSVSPLGRVSPPHTSVDIDTWDDLVLAEKVYSTNPELFPKLDRKY